jgi:hypothetical protein
MGKEMTVQLSKLENSGRDYLEDCRKLSPAERIACIQKLRVAFWGDEAATGRVQRIPEYIKRSGS